VRHEQRHQRLRLQGRALRQAKELLVSTFGSQTGRLQRQASQDLAPSRRASLLRCRLQRPVEVLAHAGGVPCRGSG